MPLHMQKTHYASGIEVWSPYAWTFQKISETLPAVFDTTTGQLHDDQRVDTHGSVAGQTAQEESTAKTPGSAGLAGVWPWRTPPEI